MSSACASGVQMVLRGLIAVPVSRPIKRDNAVLLRSKIYKSARLKVLNHTAVTVKKNQRRTRALVNVVKSNTIDRNEPAGGRIFALGFLRKVVGSQLP